MVVGECAARRSTDLAASIRGEFKMSCEASLLIENALPPLRPASVARTWSLENLRFSSSARSLPLRAISRCLSSSVEAKPQFGMLRLLPPLLLEAHSWFSQFTQYEIAPNSHTNLKIDGSAWRSFSSSREKSYATAQFPLRRASQSTTSTTTRRVGSTMTVRSFTIA